MQSRKPYAAEELELVAAVGALKTQNRPYETRVGIATGLVVVGDLIGSGASQEQAIVGETPNLAARSPGVEAPNSRPDCRKYPKAHRQPVRACRTSERRTSRVSQGQCEVGWRCDPLQSRAALRLYTQAV